MKKKSKFGQNTGASLHLSINRSLMKKMGPKQQTIQKWIVNGGFQSLTADEAVKVANKGRNYVEDYSMPYLLNYYTDAIMLSLNKKKRWILLENICTAIDKLKDDEQIYGPLDFAITLIEREVNPLGHAGIRNYCHGRSTSSLKKSDCIGYHDSRLEQPHVTPTKSKHANFTGLRSAEKFRQSHMKIRGQNGSSDTSEEEEMFIHQDLVEYGVPEIRYEMCQPMSIPAHKHMQKRQSTGSDGSQKKTPRGHYRGKTYKGIRHAGLKKWDLVHDSKTVAFDIEEEMMIEAAEASLENTTCSSQIPSPAHAELCADINELIVLSHKRASQSKYKKEQLKRMKAKRKVATRDEYVGKKHIIFEGQDEAKGMPDTDTFVLVPSPDVSKARASNDRRLEHLSPSVCLNICSEDLEPDALKIAFGRAYQESASLPRCFLLRLDLLPPVSDQEIKPAGELCAMFESIMHVDTDPGNCCKRMRMQIKSNKDDIYLHYLHMHLDGLSTCQNNDGMKMDVIVEQLQEFVKQQPCVTGISSSQVTFKELPFSIIQPRLSVQKEVCKWPDAKSHNPADAYRILDLDPDVITKKYRRGGVAETMTSDPNYCDICFLEINTDAADSHQVTASVAMKACQHWFCSECWQGHLAEKITLRSMVIRCPASSCDERVDRATLARFLPLSLLHQHEEHVNSMKLESSPQWKWCPNTYCGRVVHADGVVLDTLSVRCVCGEAWCWQCLGQPHWPASCQHTQMYRKTLQKMGHQYKVQGKFIHSVMAKPCPTCHYPIDKNGGCNYMSCILCHTPFCWSCVKPFDGRSHIGCHSGNQNRQEFQLEDVVPELHNSFYKLALRHRYAVQSWNAKKSFQKLFSTAIKMKKKNMALGGGFLPEQMIDSMSPWVRRVMTMIVPDERNPLLSGSFHIAQQLGLVAVFVIQVHECMEYVYAFLSLESKKKGKVIRNKCRSFELILDTIEKALYERQNEDYMSLQSTLTLLVPLAIVKLRNIYKASASIQ